MKIQPISAHYELPAKAILMKVRLLRGRSSGTRFGNGELRIANTYVAMSKY